MAVALINRPTNIAIKVFFFLKPNRWLAKDPVHAPVKGRGMPTKRTIP